MPAVRFEQGPTAIYVGALPASDITDLMIVDQWYPEKGWDLSIQGYQRVLYDDHIRDLQYFLSTYRDELLPTAVVLAGRDLEAHQLYFEGDGPIGYLVIKPGTRFYVIDGQHRLIAIDRMLREDPSEVVGAMQLPVVVLAGITKIEELRQFHLINNRQRRISTNLAFALLGTAAENDATVAKPESTEGHRWTA